MFDFLKKRQITDLPFSVIGTDMHSHLIPAIDDGVQSVEESITVIKQLRDLGYKKIITTPHTYQEYYPNTNTGIIEGLQKLKNSLAKAEIDIEIIAASEYYMDEHFEQLLNKKDLLTLGDTNYVLVEISFFGAPPALEEYIFQMGLASYRPVLAHPERYPYFANHFEKYERLIDLGCSLQINALSLTGHYGVLAQKTAEKLLKREMVSFFGTDCHNENHARKLRLLGQSNKWRKYSTYPFKNMEL